MNLKAILIFLAIVSCCHSCSAQDSLLYPTVPQGMQAPQFRGTTASGKVVALSTVKARFVVLYFYDLNCHLCASLLPELKKLYESYHQSGLEIVSVPLESNEKEWKKYQHENELKWMDLFSGNVEEIKQKYKLDATPTFYLLDKNKTILTQRMSRVEALEEELNRWLH